MKGFKAFFEEKEDYFSALKDEMGISDSNIKKAIETDPWISSHFNLNSIKYKQSPWEIVPGTLTKNGADIRLKSQSGNRSYLDDNKVNKGQIDTQRYHLNREELEKLLTQGWTPAILAAQQSQMPGMM